MTHEERQKQLKQALAINMRIEVDKLLRSMIAKYGEFIEPETFTRMKEQFEEGLISGCEAILKLEDLLHNPQ